MRNHNRQLNAEGTPQEVPSFFRWLRRIGRAAADLVYPVTCPHCRRYLARDDPWPLCHECQLLIEPLAGSLCPICGHPAPSGTLCQACEAGRTPEPSIRLRSVARYAGPVRSAILAAKAGGRQDIARRLGDPLLSLVPPLIDEPSKAVFVPVPLHPIRRRQRGFNLTDDMARTVAAGVGARSRPGWLRRTQNTASQVGKSLEERVANVAGAFACPRPESVVGSRVVLVDDVATTAATLAACARPLLDAGASEVVGITLARALSPLADRRRRKQSV